MIALSAGQLPLALFTPAMTTLFALVLGIVAIVSLRR
jgi:hypothetical protein